MSLVVYKTSQFLNSVCKIKQAHIVMLPLYDTVQNAMQ